MTFDIRAIRWPEDEAGIASLNTDWTAERQFTVVRGVMSFALQEQALASPYKKKGQPPDELLDELRRAQDVFVAEHDGRIVGVIAVHMSEWNFRPSICEVRVDVSARRQGIGEALVRAAIDAARATGARGLWLEVTNVNVPAIALYRKCGFRLCGLDETLYMRWGLGGEVALYFLFEFA